MKTTKTGLWSLLGRFMTWLRVCFWGWGLEVGIKRGGWGRIDFSMLLRNPTDDKNGEAMQPNYSLVVSIFYLNIYYISYFVLFENCLQLIITCIFVTPVYLIIVYIYFEMCRFNDYPCQMLVKFKYKAAS